MLSFEGPDLDKAINQKVAGINRKIDSTRHANEKYHLKIDTMHSDTLRRYFDSILATSPTYRRHPKR